MNNKNFFKIFIGALACLFLTHAGWAASQFEMGFQLGSMNPDQDALVQQSFGSGFNFDFYMGALTDSGLEYRFDVEAYGVDSHHPADVGLGRTLTLVPLEANLIYNFFGKSALRPYVGVGAGVYFYRLSQTFFPNLNSGAVFAPNVILGIKSFLGEEFFFNLEYQRHFVPKIIFNNANDFYLSDISVGIGFALDASVSSKPSRPQYQQNQPKYLYQRNQEETLVEIQQINRELKLLTERQKEIEEELSQIYQYSYEDSFDYQNRIRFYEGDRVIVERQLTNAKNRLSVLNARWVQIRPDKRNLNDHIQYLKSNYQYSPYQLRYQGYYLCYTPTYQYRYYQPVKREREEERYRVIQKPVLRPLPKPEQTQYEKEVYEKKRQEALKQIQERQKIREKEEKPIEKIDESRVRDEAREKEKDRLERERVDRERLERERVERDRQERERKEKEDKDRRDKELKDKENQGNRYGNDKERERVEQERVENQRKEQERIAKEKEERDRQDKERIENERKERERVERDRQERERKEKEERDKKDKENQGNHYGNDKEDTRNKETQNRNRND